VDWSLCNPQPRSRPPEVTLQEGFTRCLQDRLAASAAERPPYRPPRGISEAPESRRRHRDRPAGRMQPKLLDVEGALPGGPYRGIEAPVLRPHCRILPRGAGTLPHGADRLPHGAGRWPHGSDTCPAGQACCPAGGDTLPHGAGTVPRGAGTSPREVGALPHGANTSPRGAGSSRSSPYSTVTLFALGGQGDRRAAVPFRRMNQEK